MKMSHYRKVTILKQYDHCTMADTKSPEQEQEQEEEQQEELEEEVKHGVDEDVLSRCTSLTPNDTNRGRLLCWGHGEIGQTNDISCRNGMLERFAATPPGGRVKLVACGSNHTVVVTCKSFIFCEKLYLKKVYLLSKTLICL